ncbi:MAG: hypothetical protein AAGF76_15245 [Pseudomonadota bacterium]
MTSSRTGLAAVLMGLLVVSLAPAPVAATEASTGIVQGGLQGSWRSASGSLVDCDAARCDRILPGSRLVVDTLAYRVEGRRLLLRSLIGETRAEFWLDSAPEGGEARLTGRRTDRPGVIALERIAGPIERINDAPLPTPSQRAAIIEAESAPLRPLTANGDPVMAAD